MKISIAAALFSIMAMASAVAIEEPGMKAVRREVLLQERQGQNNGRPLPTGACCVAATNLKQDVCNVNGQAGRCVPSGVNNCGDRLTCIEDSRLVCDPNTLERGRPLCRLAGGA